jgi:glycosyltransferase involved in cell wall biosynthesis
MKLYVDMRCLQDPCFAMRGVGLHSSAVLRQARYFLTNPLEIIGIVDGNLPPLPTPYACLADRTQQSKVPDTGSSTGVFLELSPMTHEMGGFAPMLKRKSLISAAIVYDFIPLAEPERYLPNRLSRSQYLSKMTWLGSFDLFFPISKFSANELRKNISIDGQQVHVTGASLRNQFSSFDSDAPALLIKRPRFPKHAYFVVVAGADPRKNLEVVLSAHAEAVRTTQKWTGLAIVGHYPDSYRGHIKHLYESYGGIPALLDFFEGISDSELAMLYNRALATICPSRIEGFSLPVIESLASGCPVLISSCEAQMELIPDPRFQFRWNDSSTLSEHIRQFMSGLWNRDQILASQKKELASFTEVEVGRKLWSPISEKLRSKTQSDPVARKRRPRIAFITPFPPDHSGVATYTAASIQSIAEYADVDVFTDATVVPSSHPKVSRFQPISQIPYLTDRYDRVVSILGNSHFHTKIFNLALQYGGACISHDNRMSDFYYNLLGPRRFIDVASRTLGRPVSQSEAVNWMHNPHQLPVTFFDEIIEVPRPFIVHSRGIQSELHSRHGKVAEYLPFCPYRSFSSEQLLSEARRSSRDLLRISSSRIIIVTLGIIHDTKGPLDCVWAIENLVAWGYDVELHMVGSTLFELSRITELSERLGVADRIHVSTQWINDQAYEQFLLAADFAIQLRTHGFGGLSGAVLDCIVAGIPTVVNDDLAQSMEAPEYLMRIPDHISPALIAERLADAIDSRMHHERNSASREQYLKTHNFDSYARQLIKILDL